MKEVMYFKTQKERLDYLKGGFEEIMPKEAIVPKEAKKPSESVTEPSDKATAEKPKKATKKKGKKKDDTVQAE